MFIIVESNTKLKNSILSLRSTAVAGKLALPSHTRFWQLELHIDFFCSSFDLKDASLNTFSGAFGRHFQPADCFVLQRISNQIYLKQNVIPHNI
jgi:hypothetical protein